MPSDLKRYHDSGHEHFITFSCYHRQPWLNSDAARAVFESVLEGVRQRHQFYLFGYVLMPEHVHLLLTEPQEHPLSTTMSVLKRETSRRLKRDRSQFWQIRYYDFNVLSQAKHVEKLRYMHRNPVDRGLVGKPEDWRWSSFNHYLTGAIGPVEVESNWTWQRREHEASASHPSR